MARQLAICYTYARKIKGLRYENNSTYKLFGFL